MEASKPLSAREKTGKYLLILIGALVVLNGVGWFFVGPSLSSFEQDTGVPLAQFAADYPAAAHLLSLQARNTAILLIGLGLLGLGHVLSGKRGEGRFVRSMGWIFGLTLAGVGISELVSGAVFGIAYLTLGILALVGQALYRR